MAVVAADLPDYLAREVPGFGDSPERLALAERGDRPAEVADAAGRYLLRLQRVEIRRLAEPEESAALARGYAVIEELAESDDPAVHAALLTILDRLHSDDVVVAVAETRLGVRSLALYRRWAV
jgi:hypothetical protein